MRNPILAALRLLLFVPVPQYPEEENPLRQVHGHSITYRIAIGPQQGKKVFTLHTLLPKEAEDDRVRYVLKTPYRDGTTHVVFEPLDFMARLAALASRTGSGSERLTISNIREDATGRIAGWRMLAG